VDQIKLRAGWSTAGVVDGLSATGGGASDAGMLIFGARPRI
jgi:hypothetical protein